MGTTYSIICFDAETNALKSSIDSLLKTFNTSLNTWDEKSEISRFNTDSSFMFSSPFFLPVLAKSKEVYNATHGAFDPTVMPLVNHWGFGPGKDQAADSTAIDSLLNFVGFTNIGFDQDKVWKKNRLTQLDFSAIAKGYGVDVVSEYLLSLGHENHFVEIGGEVRCMGLNVIKGAPWNVGITDPKSQLFEQALMATIRLTDKSMATSGNYYNYKIKNGVRYSHTINPVTGYPIEHPILSATVVADDCMTADAYATAFMVLGHEKAIELLEKTDQIEGFLIYSGPDGSINTYATEKIKDKIKGIESEQ